MREALDGHGCFTPSSLDRPVGDEEGAALGELIGVEDGGQSAAEARVALAPVVRRLSRRDRHILELRFFEGLTQREIAEDIGVTQMQVSRLLSRIFRDLREDLGSVSDPDVAGALGWATAPCTSRDVGDQQSSRKVRHGDDASVLLPSSPR